MQDRLFRRLGSKLAVALAALAAVPSPANAEMVLSEVIVDLQPGKPNQRDVEVWNNDTERMFVVAEPSEIQSPGTPAEQRVNNPDPAVSGILVTPQRMVLEPGERRIIRMAAIAQRGAKDRIYRVTVKPVAGDVTAETTAVKVLVGYDVLVLVRPQNKQEALSATRSGRHVTFRNDGNTAMELFDGKQCDAAGQNCRALRPTRIYAGATWEQDVEFDTPLEYQVSSGNGARTNRF